MGLPQTNLKVGPSDKLAEVGNEAFAESLAATPSALDKGSASTSEKGVVSVRWTAFWYLKIFDSGSLCVRYLEFAVFLEIGCTVNLCCSSVFIFANSTLTHHHPSAFPSSSKWFATQSVQFRFLLLLTVAWRFFPLRCFFLLLMSNLFKEWFFFSLSPYCFSHMHPPLLQPASVTWILLCFLPVNLHWKEQIPYAVGVRHSDAVLCHKFCRLLFSWSLGFLVDRRSYPLLVS